MSNQYRDEIAMVCHETMIAIHRVGGISDAELREFEADCFVQEPEIMYAPEQVSAENLLAPEYAVING
jgi:hypothetical protein